MLQTLSSSRTMMVVFTKHIKCHDTMISLHIPCYDVLCIRRLYYKRYHSITGIKVISDFFSFNYYTENIQPVLIVEPTILVPGDQGW